MVSWLMVGFLKYLIGSDTCRLDGAESRMIEGGRIDVDASNFAMIDPNAKPDNIARGNF